MSATTTAPRLRGGRTKRILCALVGLGLLAGATACVVPSIPSYPYWGPFGSRQGVIDKATAISNGLEQYVKDVLDNKKPATIPASLLPDGLDPDLKAATWTVQRESQIDPSKQWIKREAIDKIDWNAVRGNAYPEPHATYLFMPHFVIPFGSKAVITGTFPRARFFDIQATPAFQPEQYAYQAYGVGEVPIVDADINPNPGSTNPYRVGANRLATARDYTVTFESKIGNSAQIDPVYKPPFRSQTNTRTTSGLSYRGPWGDPNYPESHGLIDKRGYFTSNELWVRIYAPDKAVDKYGGAGLPKVTYQLPDGRKYYIQADLTAFDAKINQLGKIHSTAAEEPGKDATKEIGWYKMWGIINSGVSGAVREDLWGQGYLGKDYPRNLQRAVAGLHEDLPAPLNYESSKTLCYYCHYLNRGMAVGSGKVAVLTGRLPTTPKTRGGLATMPSSQARYFSITTYDSTIDSAQPFAMPITSIMDDEIITDANGYYTIVYSRAADRPANATAANGVTWVDWGPMGKTGWMLRWLDVGPEWTFAKAPNQVNLGRGSDWSSPNWNPALTAKNDHSGFLGEYQPRVSYMDKATFQNIGSGWITEARVPAWK